MAQLAGLVYCKADGGLLCSDSEVRSGKGSPGDLDDITGGAIFVL